MKEKGIHDIKLFFSQGGSIIDSFRDPLCYPVQEKVTEPVAETVVNTVSSEGHSEVNTLRFFN